MPLTSMLPCRTISSEWFQETHTHASSLFPRTEWSPRLGYPGGCVWYVCQQSLRKTHFSFGAGHLLCALPVLISALKSFPLPEARLCHPSQLAQPLRCHISSLIRPLSGQSPCQAPLAFLGLSLHAVKSDARIPRPLSTHPGGPF